MMLKGLFTCERKGGWGKMFWWVRMSLWYVRLRRPEPRYTLAA